MSNRELKPAVARLIDLYRELEKPHKWCPERKQWEQDMLASGCRPSSPGVNYVIIDGEMKMLLCPMLLLRTLCGGNVFNDAHYYFRKHARMPMVVANGHGLEAFRRMLSHAINQEMAWPSEAPPSSESQILMTSSKGHVAYVS